jgi:CubicO group peptidase (beta-lactamase class C family)
MSPDIRIHEEEVRLTPEEAGYSSEALTRLDALFMRLIRENKLQCASYRLARHGETIACKSMGSLCSFEDRGDFMPDSIRNIASITKIFTTLAILQLIEKGDLYLAQPVCSIIPEFDTPLHNGITLFHLLTHTSGLCPDPGYFGEPYPRNLWEDLHKGDWIKQVLSGPIHVKPMQEWQYSSAGYMILGEIISRLTGMPYVEYVIQNIIQPLELNHTFFYVPPELHKNVCFINEQESKWFPATADQTQEPASAAGGLFSTLADLQKIGQLMLDQGMYKNRRILGRKTIEVMCNNNLPDGIFAYHWGSRFPSYAQGLGWRITSRNLFSSPGSFGHEGSGRCSLYIDPVEDFIMTVFVPSNVSWVPESILSVQAVAWSGII